MSIDIVSQLGAIDRKVTTRERDGRRTHVVVANRRYDTTVEDVWDAITSAERIPRWFLPVSGDLRLGGRYQLEGNAGGEITTCNPPRVLAVSWEFAGEVSWVEVRLSEDPAGGTRLVLEHEAFVKDEWWDTYGPGATGVGWDLALFGLAEHLSTRASVTPENAQAWTVSDEGKSFVRGSSEAWERASVAFGTAPAAAQAAGARTTAFYTGEGGEP